VNLEPPFRDDSKISHKDHFDPARVALRFDLEAEGFTLLESEQLLPVHLFKTASQFRNLAFLLFDEMKIDGKRRKTNTYDPPPRPPPRSIGPIISIPDLF
jgi:hypothetical protein